MSANEAIKISTIKWNGRIRISGGRIEWQGFNLSKECFGSINLVPCLGTQHDFCPHDCGGDQLATLVRFHAPTNGFSSPVQDVDTDVCVNQELWISHPTKRDTSLADSRRTAGE